jgi:DeoR/GlpR family transcriptional regulator of sugar metabolism
MGAQSKSMAARVLAAVKEIGGEIRAADLFDLLVLQTGAQEKTARNALSDMANDGRLVRVRPGVFRLPETARPKPVSKQERMWRVIRARRRVTLADLQELAGVTKEYAKEYLLMLTKRAVMVRQPQPQNRPHVWVLVNDPVEMPENTEKAARYRAKRKAAKEKIVQALDQADTAIKQARKAVNKLDG